MGHGAQATRRGLIDTVKDCVTRTNDASALAEDVRKAHNEFSTRTVEEVRLLNARCDAQGQWLNRLERHETLTRELVHDIGKELARVRLETHQVLTSLTFAERLRFFFFGDLPPLPASLLHAVATQLAGGDWRFAEQQSGGYRANAQAAAQDVAEKQTVREFAAADCGMSAGMAPRPLP